MKLSAVLNDIATNVANDVAIETYCQAKFGKSVSVHVHIDPKNPPKASKAPWVGLTIQGYNRPVDTNVVVVQFDVEAAVYCVDEDETTVGKVTTLDGFDTLEDLSDLVFASVETSISTSATQLNMTYVNEQATTLTISDFPAWIASKVFTAAKHV